VTSPGDHGANEAGWEDLARRAGEDAEPTTRGDSLRQLLSFVVGEATYAVPVESVREIVRIRPITPIPRVSRDVRGVIALRGEVVQVVDLRRRLGLESIEPTRTSRIVVVHQDDGRVTGVLVDAVREVMRVPEEAIGPPAGGESVAVEALCNHGDEFVSLVALDRVLQVDAES
jgi:purine-binding chemotaxis protein CheW